MKLRWIFIGLLLCFGSVYAQPTGGPGSSEDFAPPTITPVSPEAGSMKQYGEIPVNMSAGQMSFQVPIFDIPIRGGYSWPVHLNYRYAGLILEAKPSIAGLGWLLSGGGVVTREVRGIPDGNPRGIYGTEHGDLITPIVQGNYITYDEALEVVGGTADTELDRYNVSVGGVSFAFKIDSNNNPIYLSEHNYTVTFPNPTPTYVNNKFYADEIASFTVKDDQGIEYLFDEVEINEPKGLDLAPTYSETAGPFGYFSSWQLSKVTFPNGQIITLGYADDLLLNYDYSANGYKNIDAPFVTQVGSCSDLQNATDYQETVRLTHIERKLLDNITFPTGSIEMVIDSSTTRKLYDKIRVKDSGGAIIDEFDLTFDGSRDVLIEVDKDGFFYYEFEYNNVGAVPDFLDDANDRPYAMDFWGFYNQRGNNYMVDIPQSSISADKRPNEFASKMGALTRIKYPTGGHSDIQYVQNKVKKLVSEVDDETFTPNRQIWLKLETDNVASASPTKSVTFTYTFDDPTIALVSHKLEGYGDNSDINAIISTTCTPSPNPQEYYDAAPYLRGLGNPVPEFCVNLSQFINPGGQGGGPTIYNENSEGHIKIKPGTYTFSISAAKNNEVSAISRGEILVQFYDPPDTSGGGDPYIDAAIGGIRVNSITHVDNHGSVTKQLYDYTGDDGLSTGVELARGQNEYQVGVLYDCWIDDTGTTTGIRYFFNRMNYLSSYYNPVNLNSGVPVFYERVIQYPKRELVELFNDGPPFYIYPYPQDQNPDGSLIFTEIGGSGNTTNFTEDYRFTYGYTLNEFELPDYNFGQIYYPFPPQGDDLSIGRPKQTITYAYDQDSTSYDLRKDALVTYLDKEVNPISENHPYNVKCAPERLYINALQAGVGLNLDYSNGKIPPLVDGSNNEDYFHMFVYRDADRNFIPGVVTDYSYSQEGEEVETVTTNSYDSDFQLKETEVTDSKGNTIKQVFYYPYDLPEYIAMVNDNQIAKVVKREVKENNILNQTVKINFTSVSGDYKPNRLEGAKGAGSLEDRLFYEYDGLGNVKEYYSGTHNTGGGGPSPVVKLNVVSFIWGYDKRLPVAKIDGVAYDELPSSLVTDIQNETNEAQLIIKLQQLRDDPALAGGLVTTYTYDPWVGVTSETDPRGYTIYYEYDAQDRLERIRDEDNNILQEFSYNLVTD